MMFKSQNINNFLGKFLASSSGQRHTCNVILVDLVLVLLLPVLHQPDSKHDEEDLGDLLAEQLGLVNPSPGLVEPTAPCTSFADLHGLVEGETL